ncbi:MAG: hypothetical protein Q4G60_12320 [bacterium]|nr:hypothetical protein [bacterium]
MNKVLRKRMTRDLRANAMRYLALLLLIVMGMYVVVSIVGASENVITGTKVKSVENKTEDGQFGVFLPLSARQEQELRATGITLEKMFSMDIQMPEDSVLRLMQNRQDIDLIDVDTGRQATAYNEVVLEKRYSEEHEIVPGDVLVIAGIPMTVVGIGSVPDYDMPTRTYSDVAVESSLFGLAFVTPEQYVQIRSASTGLTEDYCYAYRLNGKLTDEELKDKIKEQKFNYEDINDPYFQEMIAEITDLKQELRDGTTDLNDGAADLYDGAEELTDGVNDLTDGASDLRDGAADLKGGARDLNDGAGNLKNGVMEVQDALVELDSNSASLTDGSAEVKDALQKIQSGLSESGSISAEDLTKLSEASTQIKDGVTALNAGLSKVNEAVGTYSQALSAVGLTDIGAFVTKHTDAVSQLGITDTMRILYEAYQKGDNQGFSNKLTELAQSGDTEAGTLAGKVQQNTGAATEYLTNAGKMLALEKLIQVDIQYIQGSAQLISGIDAALDPQSGELMIGAVKLQAGCTEFDAKIQELVTGLSALSGGMNELKNGVNTLTGEYTKLDDGIHEYTDAVYEILDGYGELVDGAVDLYDGTDELYSGTNELYDGTVELQDGAGELQDGTRELYDGSAELKDGTDELKTKTTDVIDEYFTIDMDNLMSFIKASDNPRIAAAAGDVLMEKQLGMVAGVIVMMLFTYVISVFVIHQIQTESSVIGALYALGVRKKDLLLHYITLPTLISFTGGLIGAAFGFSRFGTTYQMEDTYAYFSVPQYDCLYPAYLIIYSIVMPPVVSALVNYFVIRKKLSRTALSLIKNEQNIQQGSGLHLKNQNFIRSFQIRQMLREARTGMTVILGMIISLIILMLGVDCYVLCDNVRKEMHRDTRYEYMYSLKYPEKTVPEGGEACYSEALSKTYLDFTLDVTILGIDDDNPYFDVETVKGKNKIITSQSVMQKYGLKTGDKLVLSDIASEMDYVFTIEGVCEYSSGLMVFMDIDSMRELFGREEDYYNVVFSDVTLPIAEGRLYSVTTREDVNRSSDVFVKMMMPTIVMLVSVAVIIFCTVMYLMMNVMVDRAGFGISLIKIFGFRNREVKKLYLNGNMYIVGAGAVIGIPISKRLADAMYPWLIANTSCGMNLRFPWYLSVGIFLGIMFVYQIINLFLVRKLNAVSPAEVLKNRE